MDLPIVKFVPQRFPMDCGVSCLAMVCQVPYEAALVAVATHAPEVATNGCWEKHLRAGARRLGFVLRKRRTFDLDEDTGILNLEGPQFKGAHLVVLWEGRILDPADACYRPDIYMDLHQSKATALYVVEKQAA